MRSIHIATLSSAVLIAANCVHADDGLTKGQPRPTLQPNIQAQPLPNGGAMITPSVTGTVPIAPNVILHGTVRAPIVVPPHGSPIVQPSANFGATIQW